MSSTFICHEIDLNRIEVVIFPQKLILHKKAKIITPLVATLPIYSGLVQAPIMLGCKPGGLVIMSTTK